MEKPSSLPDRLWKFDSFCACASPEKLGICHDCRPVSRNRQILILDMEVGKASDVAHLQLIF